MLSLKSSDEIAYNGSNNCARMDLFADTAADLTGVTTFDSIVLLAGSSALDISTGDLYIMKSDGTWVLQPGTGAFSNVYTKAEIDSMLLSYYTKAEADELFVWKTITIEGESPLDFIGDGTPLIAWTVVGNEVQTGTPTPTVPITPEEFGDLVESGEHAGEYAIPITLAGQTQNIYLTEPLRKIGDYADTVEQDGTVTRRVKKLVLDGTENWALWSSGEPDVERYYYKWGKSTPSDYGLICTHFPFRTTDGNFEHVRLGGSYRDDFVIYISKTIAQTVADFKTYLAAQYAAGTPVTIWYVLNYPTTETATVPTLTPTKGSNTLTVDTSLPTSGISITGQIREE